MYNYTNEQAIRARVADQKDVHACVEGNEKSNAPQTCIWFEIDLIRI